MQEIKLQWSEQICLVDDDDFIRFNPFNWYLNANGYIVTDVTKYKREEIGSVKIRLHRLIMCAPKGKDVDHINGNKLDNRKENLRICTRSENLANKETGWDKKQIALKGVFVRKTSKNKKNGKTYELKRPFFSAISINGKNKYLGSFCTPQEAHQAYKNASIALLGTFSFFKRPGERTDLNVNKQQKK